MHVCVYFKDGVEVACVPPDPEPEEGQFSTWYTGTGDTLTEAYDDAMVANDCHAYCMAPDDPN